MPQRRRSRRISQRVKVEREPDACVSVHVSEIVGGEGDEMNDILGSLQALGSLKDEVMGELHGDIASICPHPAPSEPYIEITEQPKQRDHRFRYPVEGRQAGSIAGEKASSDIPSYPSIKVHNLNGRRAKAVVSLVTKDTSPQPHPHPHRLVGDNCKDGVCCMIIDPQHSEAVFRKIGVQRTMNKEVENSLAERKKAGVRLSMEVNKGKTGKKHNYDMKCVRLFFEVHVESREGSNIFDQYLEPITSTPIYDKKDTVLTICRVNISHGSVAGGDELFILCEKVQSDDIQVVFTGIDPDKPHQQWRSFAPFGPSDVHRQFAIVCATPKFVNQGIRAAHMVKFQLYRPSDEEYSNEMEFTYKPLNSSSGDGEIEKKKRKFSHMDGHTFERYFTTKGKPCKTETLGASAQSCRGNPISNPVSNTASTLTVTPMTTTTSDSRQVKENLRRIVMERGDPSSGGGSRPSTPSSTISFPGTAQLMDDSQVVTTTTSYTSEAHMSSGLVIQQHHPVSQDVGSFTNLSRSDAEAVLMSLATNQQVYEMGNENEERLNSDQKISAIANELMAIGGAVGGGPSEPTANRVVVEQMELPSLPDIQFSSLTTIDMGSLQDGGSFLPSFAFAYSQQDESMEDNNISASGDNNSGAM
ncbi:uncharacterized protein [Diadema antillarum]|uniref:uncharacterized protein isoform X1 n=2 Tax=Diadema antillarum TaxID=105358 RepID=UPI003A8C25F9